MSSWLIICHAIQHLRSQLTFIGKIHPNVFIYYYSPHDPKSYAFTLWQSPTSLFSPYCSWMASCFLHILLILFLGTKLNHLTISAVSGGFAILTDVLHRIGPMTYLMTYCSLVSCGMCATSCYELQTMVLHTSFTWGKRASAWHTWVLPAIILILTWTTCPFKMKTHYVIL